MAEFFAVQFALEKLIGRKHPVWCAENLFLLDNTKKLAAELALIQTVQE